MASLVLACLLIVGLMVLAFADESSRWLVVLVVVVLSVAPIVAIVTAYHRIRGQGACFRYGPVGFENRTGLVGTGSRTAMWSDVVGLEVHGQALVIRLQGGGRSVVHASVLGEEPQVLGMRLRRYVGRPF